MSESPPRRRVLITGAAGQIGSQFALENREKYDLRLMARESDRGKDAIAQFGEVVIRDLSDLDGLKRACDGIDTVVHMAANPNPSALWRDILAANIVGTYNVFAAAKSAGCRRVIYASSIHAVSGYAPDVQVKTSDPVKPGDLYGVSKCFGEALARYMAEQEGLSSIVIRIAGYMRPSESVNGPGITNIDILISSRDLMQLIGCCVDVENVRFAIVHGVSNSRFKRLDISDTRTTVGYAPQDDFSDGFTQIGVNGLKESPETCSLRDPGERSGLRADIK